MHYNTGDAANSKYYKLCFHLNSSTGVCCARHVDTHRFRLNLPIMACVLYVIPDSGTWRKIFVERLQVICG